MANRLDVLFENHLGRTAHIVLASSSSDGRGNTFLSSECRTLGELTHALNRIREDLDRIEAEAKKEFAKPRPPLFAEQHS